jgi:hypothetical protein
VLPTFTLRKFQIVLLDLETSLIEDAILLFLVVDCSAWELRMQRRGKRRRLEWTMVMEMEMETDTQMGIQVVKMKKMESIR